MAECRKPINSQFMVAIATLKKKMIFDLGRPGRAVGTHLRVLEDSVNIFCWFQCSENPNEFKDTFGDFFGAIDFNGQKLCDMQPVDKAWYQAFRQVHKDMFDFISAAFPAIMKWNGEKMQSEAVYKKHMLTVGGSQPLVAVALVQAPTPVPEEAKKPEEVKKPVPVKKAAPAKKEPVKVLKFKTWEISNYGKETLTFSAEEVQPGMTFNFFNCEKTKVVVEGKCKNLML